MAYARASAADNLWEIASGGGEGHMGPDKLEWCFSPEAVCGSKGGEDSSSMPLGDREVPVQGGPGPWSRTVPTIVLSSDE